MMRNALLLAASSAPLLVSAALQTYSNGGAVIVNHCNFPISMNNVPAQAPGIENGQAVSKTLAANNVGSGSTYTTPWIKLNLAGGWSMKLDPSAGAQYANCDGIMQFEYTWTGDAQVWFDASLVNGQISCFPPWYLTPDGGATKLTNYYSYSTDDAAGMQAPVPLGTYVTMVLCPDNAGSAPTSAPTTTNAPAPAPTTTTTTTTTPPPPSTTTTTTTTLVTSTSAANKNIQNTPAPSSSTTTTTTTTTPDVEIVTEYATQIVTAIVTETAVAHAKVKRHEHRHPHAHRLF